MKEYFKQKERIVRSSFKMAKDSCFVALSEQFDWESVVVEEPVTTSFTKGGQTTPQTTSNIHVKGPNGEKLPLCFELEKQNIWINSSWPYGTKQEDQTLDKMNGFQIAYPLTSMGTVSNPTDREKATRRVFEMIWETTVKALQKFAVKDPAKRKVPGATWGAFLAARDDLNWSIAVKPLFDATKTKDPKSGKMSIDSTKPKKAYIKFLTMGIGKKLVCQTQLFGPQDRLINPITYGGKPQRGDGHPVILWDSIYWGAHGQTSYGASIRLRLAEMNFVPSTVGSITCKRMLGPNTAVAVEPEFNGDDDFTHPMGENKNDFTPIEMDNNVEALLNGNIDETLDEEAPIVETKRPAKTRKVVSTRKKQLVQDD